LGPSFISGASGRSKKGLKEGRGKEEEVEEGQRATLE
jgi:hypothetical protein